MTIYNPIASMQRLEAAGLKRPQAEALASELTHAREDLVTKDDLQTTLDAALAKQTLRICSVLGAVVTLASIALGVLISLHN